MTDGRAGPLFTLVTVTVALTVTCGRGRVGEFDLESRGDCTVNLGSIGRPVGRSASATTMATQGSTFGPVFGHTGPTFSRSLSGRPRGDLVVTSPDGDWAAAAA